MADQRDVVTLKVVFEPGRRGMSLRWEADVLGVRVSRVVLPYCGADLVAVLGALDALQDPYYPAAWTAGQEAAFAAVAAQRVRLERLGLWEGARVSPAAPRMVGRALFAALTADSQGAQALGTACDHAAALGQPLHVHLCFPPEATEAAVLPWELLWDDGPAPLLFSRNSGVSCARHLDLARALPPPRPAGGPLRILAIVPQAEIPAELRQMERAARMEALGPLLETEQATLREVSPASRAEIWRAVEQERPDMIHYYGHGLYARGRGALLLDSPDGHGVWTSAGALATLFGRARLVVLHACQGAMVRPEAGEAALLSGVAHALSAAGVPIVVAMQLAIRTEAATRFGAAFYAALAAGASVDEASGQARGALYATDDEHASWYVPALYLRTRRLEPAYLVAPTHAEPVPATGARGVVQTIIARGGAVVRNVRMRGRTSTEQQLTAEEGATVDQVEFESGR